MPSAFANYHEQRAAFKALFFEGCQTRILLLKGPSGSGKSSLIKACLAGESAEKKRIAFELKDSRVGIQDILDRAVLLIGKDSFPRYLQCIHDITPTKPQISLNDISQTGGTNTLSVMLNVQDQREQRQIVLTSAWFEDIAGLDTPLVFAFDTYEQAASEVRKWISGSFLTHTLCCNTVRVAIAGQDVPDPGIEAWGDRHVLHELFGVREAKEWMPVVDALGKAIPASNPLDWMAGTCNALKGKPSEIMEVIKILPDRSNLITTGTKQ